jgi:hypothetical protein
MPTHYVLLAYPTGTYSERSHLVYDDPVVGSIDIHKQ